MILVVSHFAKNKGTTDFFVDYLCKKEKDFLLLKHPLNDDYGEHSELYTYSGEERIVLKKFKKSRSGLLRMIQDFIISIQVSIYLNGKANTVYAFGSFNAAPFILTNLFLRRKVYFWGVDYSEKRFNSVVLNKLYFLFETFACYFSTRVINQSKRQEEVRVKKHGLVNSKSIVSSNGVISLDFNKDFSKYNNLALIYIGSISKQHGILELVDELYVKQKLDKNIYIIGEGELSKRLTTIIEKNYLQDRVRYIGFKTQEEIVKFLETCEECLVGIAPYQQSMKGHMYYVDSIKVKEYLNYNIFYLVTDIVYIQENLKKFGITYNSYQDLIKYLKSDQKNKFFINIPEKNKIIKNYYWNSLFEEVIKKISYEK